MTAANPAYAQTHCGVVLRWRNGQGDWFSVECTLPYRHHEQNGTPHAGGLGFAWVLAKPDASAIGVTS